MSIIIGILVIIGLLVFLPWLFGVLIMVVVGIMSLFRGDQR
jgi:hypothetical protein